MSVLVLSTDLKIFEVPPSKPEGQNSNGLLPRDANMQNQNRQSLSVSAAVLTVRSSSSSHDGRGTPFACKARSACSKPPKARNSWDLHGKIW